MASYNKVIMIGNLTRDPSLTYLPNTQTPVCEIGLAVNRRWRNRDGQQQEKVCFIDCRAYAKRAEILNQYLSKGQPLMVEGYLDFDRWEAQDGTTRSKHRLMIENFQFLGGPSGGGQGSAPQRNENQGDQMSPPDDIYDGPPPGDDIPF